MPSVKLFIFDWDGTLMDSERQIVHCMQLAAAELELVVPEARAVRAIIGLGLPEAIQKIFPRHSPAVREAVRQAYARHFIAEAGGRSELFPGARELLDTLRATDSLMAIATGKSRMGLDRVLGSSGLASYFHLSRCADETASKPDPRMLHEILESLAVSPREAVMIGDTTYDLEMASRAGMRSVAVSHGVHAEEELERHGPLAIVPDLRTLAPFLASL